MTTPETTAPRAPLPPRWVIRAAWIIHRAIYSLSGGRWGLRAPSETAWGMMRLRTRGRKSGLERIAILAYFWDGPNVITMAMNGWGAAEPAWWLNLQVEPDAEVELPDGWRTVRARAATDEERPRLWAQWRVYNGKNFEGWAARRPGQTAVVVLEPYSSSTRVESTIASKAARRR